MKYIVLRLKQKKKETGTEILLKQLRKNDLKSKNKKKILMQLNEVRNEFK